MPLPRRPRSIRRGSCKARHHGNVTQLHANRAQPWDPYEVWLNRISRPREQSKAVAGKAPVMLPVARERETGSPANPELM